MDKRSTTVRSSRCACSAVSKASHLKCRSSSVRLVANRVCESTTVHTDRQFLTPCERRTRQIQDVQAWHLAHGVGNILHAAALNVIVYRSAPPQRTISVVSSVQRPSSLLSVRDSSPSPDPNGTHVHRGRTSDIQGSQVGQLSHRLRQGREALVIEFVVYALLTDAGELVFAWALCLPEPKHEEARVLLTLRDCSSGSDGRTSTNLSVPSSARTFPAQTPEDCKAL